MARTDGSFVPVRHVKAGSILLEGNEPSYRPIREMEGISMRFTPKVSAVQAQVDDFESTTIYVPTMEQMVEQAEMELFVQNQTSMAEARRFEAETAIIESDSEGGGDALPPVAGEDDTAGQLGSATEELDMLANLEDATAWGDGLVMQGDSAQGNAVRLTFSVSSETPLADAYVVASVRIWAEERLIDLTLFERVGQVTVNPRRVTMVQRDLPTGLEVKEVEVYLFNRGDEIPTNLSPKHSRITRAEAREFIRISHLGDHPRGRIPARPDWSLAPRSLLGTRDPSTYQHEVEVEIDEAGEVLAVRGVGAADVPARIKSLIEEMTFVPALEEGVPVASVLVMNPADYFSERR